MKKTVLMILFSVVCCFSAVVRAETAAFVSGFEDLPLMEGLSEHDGTGVSFDTPAGRIVEAYAESYRLTAKGILGFYARTLPQLGWRAQQRAASSDTRASYVRDGETLNVFVENGSPVIVRFELTSRGN